jgi:outer membrane protein assembly factor BamB
VFLGGGEGLSAFDAATGDPVWSAPLGYCSESSPAVANGVVYVLGTAGAPVGSVFAVDAGTGDVLWSEPIGAQARPDPRVVNGFVYAGSEDGGVYAFTLP